MPVPRRRFRYAPTPSRPLHVGSALAALVGWATARAAGGDFIVRIEDIDRTRCRREHELTCLEDLAWLGLDWDEGPDVGGPRGPYRQSERLASYDAALAELARPGDEGALVYFCTCSRAQVRAAQRAPHSHTGGESPYAGTCRPARGAATDAGDGRSAQGRGGWRLWVDHLGDAARVTWVDRWAGRHAEDVRATCGDFLLGRPGHPTYQLACVVDDSRMGVTDVVRGRDLEGSVARQVLLHRALGHEPPRWAHHPLIVDGAGRKLSKRDGDASLAMLRHAGADRDRLIARLAAAIGLVDAVRVRSLAPCDLIEVMRPFSGTDHAPPVLDGCAWHDGSLGEE